MYRQDLADQVLNFFCGVLKHTTGEFYGRPFEPMPWQEEFLCGVYGNVEDDGSRIVSEAYLELPKKSGKTNFCGGIAVWELFGSFLRGEHGFEVYSVASAMKQAALLFRAAAAMVDQSKILSKRLKVNRSTYRILRRDDPNSFYAALAADGDLSDGVNPACVIADELHRWRVRKAQENWDVLSLGGLARKQPLIVGITTAGVQDESPLCWRYHEKARQLQEGLIQDRSFFGRIYAAGPDEDWRDENTWVKAIPSLKENGGFLDIAAIRKKFTSISSEAEASAFRRYYLNFWGQSDNRAIDMQAWGACGSETRSLIERPCYAGLDLSSTVDLTSLVLLFPGDDETFDIQPFFWMPEANVREREKRDKVPYSEWVKKGLITATEGNIIDYRVIKEKLKWARECFELREVAFDPWNATQLSTELIDEGFKCMPIRQGFQSLSGPTKKLLELITAGKLRHGNHPVLRWNADCLSTKSDGNDNIRPVKPERRTSAKRIDGIVALIMALDRAMRSPTLSSVYESRGIRFI